MNNQKITRRQFNAGKLNLLVREIGPTATLESIHIAEEITDEEFVQTFLSAMSGIMDHYKGQLFMALLTPQLAQLLIAMAEKVDHASVLDQFETSFGKIDVWIQL